MDILEFREQVKVVLKEHGATFPGCEAELDAMSEIAQAAITYAGHFYDSVEWTGR